LTSLLTLRPLGFQGPSIENRKVPQRGDPGAEAHLSPMPQPSWRPIPRASHATWRRQATQGGA